MSDQPEITGGVAAVRGAVPVSENTSERIVEATSRLLLGLLELNRLDPSRIVSAIFTTTDDLDADFPAHAARRLGWADVPMLNAREIPVPGSMPRVVRVLLTVQGVTPGVRLTPLYLGEAARLRPDLEHRAAPQTVGSATTRADRPRDATRLALIGLGQIGGSIGLSLAGNPAWWRVGFDLDPRVGQEALTAGALDEVAASLEAACAGAGLAVIATPVDTIAALVDAAAAALPAGASLLDTGSARAVIHPALERAAARGLHAAGAHPIAGNEGHGFASARAGLFAGASMVICPAGDDTPEPALALAHDLGALPRRVSPAEHDHALARTSHLPYLVACALRDVGGGPAARGLSGPGFRDMTRLAASDPRMALAYCRANAAEVAAAWRELSRVMDARLRDAERPVADS